MKTNDTSESDVLIQGDKYQEEGSFSPDNETEVRDENKETKFSKFGSKMPIIIGAVIVSIILVVVIVFVSLGGKSKQSVENEGPADFLNEEEIVFEYTLSEISELRLAGYTGDEIEAFQFEERDADELIEKARDERQQQYEREIKPFYEGASDEFKELWNNSWVGQKDLVYDSNVEAFSYYTETMNVDYVRLPAKGHQLFIKFYLENGDACFMTVTPERYAKLKESGNIVLNIEYTQTGDGKRIITSIREVTP